jgi:hypothetical protein
VSCFRGDFSTAQEAVKTGVSPGCASSAITAWAVWSDYTSGLGLNPFLQGFYGQNTIPSNLCHLSSLERTICQRQCSPESIG